MMRGPKIWLVRRPKSQLWAIRYEDPLTGRTQQKATSTKDKKEAERLLGELRSDLLNHRWVGTNNTSWEAFRSKYETEVLPGLATQTSLKSDTIFDAVERILKPKKLSDLTSAKVSQFAAELRLGNRSESTIASYLAHLKAALNWAASIGLIPTAPKISRPKRAKLFKKPKGRAPTEQEFRQILSAVPQVVGESRSQSWQHFLEGLWWSGLRLGEVLELYWDRDDKLTINYTQERPVLYIPAELEKGNQDRFIPVAPEFAAFLDRTPEDQRVGRVFNPLPYRATAKQSLLNQVSKIISQIGKKANVVVHVQTNTGKKKYASAHDLRRAFGDRWALRVMPPVLMQLMRHESIETTMRYYVGRSVEATADAIWKAYENDSKSAAKPTSDHKLRDT